MKTKKDFKIFIKSTFILVPLLFIAAELSLLILNTIRGTNYLPRAEYNISKYDPISGTRGYLRKINNYTNPKKIFLDNNDLVKTPYTFKNSDLENKKGILIIGDSIAMGWGISSKDNKDTFSGILETELLKTRDDIDVVNLSFYQFNSWMIHTEIMRYFNSHKNNSDLPNPKLVINFGGLQDFWRLLFYMKQLNEEDINNYNFAKGFMLDIDLINYINNASEGLQGDLKVSTKNYMHSIFEFWRKYTYSGDFVEKLRESFWTFKEEKIENQYLVNSKNREVTLEELLIRNFDINLQNYQKIRNEFISSCIRNIKASSSAIEPIKYVYVYAPTRFTNFKDIEDSKKIIRPGKNISLTFEEISLLKNDFKNHFLNELSKIKSVKLIDYSTLEVSSNWFIDFSHYNRLGHKKIGEKLSSEVIELLNFK
tara:strand:+ start:2014 stop:3288 length:1275 start_codon:yes stop_codon:yes gene_type:complete